MGVSCIVDSIAGKICFVGEQNVTDHMGVIINPPRSPDLNPLHYHVWGYMKAMVYAHKVNTRELPQRILNAARINNNAVLLRRVTSSLATRVRKCIQTDGGHFEQFALLLNGESVTVRLTA